MGILLKRILSSVVVLILIILLASCSYQETSNKASKATSVESRAATKNTAVPAPKTGIEIQSPMTISNNKCTFNGRSAYVRLKLVEGRYSENWNPGDYMETLCEGNYVIELSDEYGKIISITDISKIYSEPLVFKSSFKIEFDDYNNDGDLDFTIGQYTSSNGNVYRIFTLRKNGCIEELSIKDRAGLFITNRTGDYSTKLNKINGTTFEIECYNNSVPATFHDSYKWDGKQFVFEKSLKVAWEGASAGNIDDKNKQYTTDLGSIPTSTNIANSTQNNGKTSTNAYSNPIDEYFIPRINNAKPEASRRGYQDTYRGVWKSEFENIMKWMNKKCKYQKDKDNLIAYENSVRQLIDSTYAVVITDWLDDYNRPPESTDRNKGGTGTRSGLNQIQAEIYRDAGMRLIGKSEEIYLFLDKDYSKEHYE